MRHLLRSIASLVLPALLALVWLQGPAASVPQGGGRVVVLGFDGADARTVDELLLQRPDDYPNFARLRAEGTFAPLDLVAPPESPVSWAALNTGQNPAKTGVPGFVRRTLDGSQPFPGLGHLRDEKRAVETFENTPIPTWKPKVMGAVAGGGTFLVILFFLLVVTRGRFVVSLIAAILFGGAAAWAGHTVRGLLPDVLPRTTNPNQARNFWDYAADAGVASVVLDSAQTFDMPAPEGAKVLSGLGVPDARGKIGDWFLYTTDPEEVDRAPKGRGTNTAGTVFRVDEYDGEIQTKIYGPENFWLEERLNARIDEIAERQRDPSLSLEESIQLTEEKSALEDELRESTTSVDMVIRKLDGKALVRIGDQEQEVAEGEWSDFFELSFELNWLIHVDAITRVRLVSLDDPYFELFVNVLDIDPRSPPFWQSISEPHGFSAELASEVGRLYETYGWATATMPFKDKEIPPEILLEDVEFTLGWREDVTMSALGRDDWRCLMSVFSTTDRVQHMMYQYYDDEHPMHDPAEAGREVEFFGQTIQLRDAIPAIYRQMDRVIGRVLDEGIRADDTLIVCSDHGFQSFRRQVNINNWLAERGYLVLKRDASRRMASALLYVDWDKTRAYSLGMGFIYVNLQGREPRGIVAPSQMDALLAEIRSDLLEATDPETGARFCKEVYVTKEVHSGPHLALEGDLLLGFAPPYRVSWASTSGGILLVDDGAGGVKPGEVCLDNSSNWSGDHISVALPDVAGVFFSNRTLADPEAGVHLLQIAPTTLSLLGVPVPPEMDLAPIELAE